MLTRTPTEILPRLWLSGLYTAVDEEQLLAIGVTHVVSVIEQRPKYPPTLKKLKTLHIPVYDIETTDLLQHLDVTTAFIKSALDDKHNTVLVHCAMGISRSATVLAAYLIATTRMQPHEAIEFLQSKREIVCPNLSFRRQLDVYAARLHRSRKLRKFLPPPLRRPAASYLPHAPLAADGIRLLRTSQSPRVSHPPPVAMTRRGSMG
ncbi:protein-tyrosine phosphatase-like protein [Dichomitus squalens]|uniref:Protein-tyrosine phosphatase-like protein n=1 Tax=Dichomitus squalens TaxID=114155 RepID=A0A4Q9P085_9APHY|nr:protein-tyrosine phosphatase-like protein [Dichomitus squalens]TBU47610.1 protein-tyrosine phosphatase-like protein [Dichomitus squalens]TBU57734.1 protein-tyrosine phosphatase-like protein [Dichomitus squalens]